MEKEFTLADPGEGIHEAEIIEVLVSEGDQVEEEESVLVIETDKATTEVPSPMTGAIKEIKVSEGDMVKVGDVLMIFEVEEEAAEEEAEPEETEAESETEAEEEKAEAGAEAEKTEKEAAESAEEKKTEEEKESAEEPKKKEKKKPEAAAKEEEEEEEEEKKKESAEEGEKEKAAKKAKKEEEEEEEEKKKKKKPPEKVSDEEKPVPAAPSTRRVARELGVDLHDVEPSGPGGRVTTEDVKAFAEGGAEKPEKKPEKKPPKEKKEKPPEKKKEKKKPAPAAPEAPELPDFSQWGEVERVPLRSVRRTTAKRMRLSWSQIPHVTHEDVADITDLETFRQKYKDEIEEEGGALTLTIFALKAAVAALKAHPRFNASLDMDQEEIILKHYYHIGAAVDTDRGLLVPVIRDVDRKSITELAKEFPALADKTRNGEADRKEMTGGTFTITNVGPLGGTGFTPIINYPQVAILGMAKARLQPVVMGNLDNYRVKPRLMLPLALGFDHRIVDGADAARFMGEIIAALENPEKLMMLT
ncbi:MAG: 2-oxo acid dehydrogenase subunit E2 [Desulfococcaceae bacterium]